MKRKTITILSALVFCATMFTSGQAIKAPKVPVVKFYLSTITGKIIWNPDSCKGIKIKSLMGTRWVYNLKPHVTNWIASQPPSNTPHFGDPHEGLQIPFTIKWGKSGANFQEYTITLKEQGKYSKAFVGFGSFPSNFFNDNDDDFTRNCNCLAKVSQAIVTASPISPDPVHKITCGPIPPPEIIH